MNNNLSEEDLRYLKNKVAEIECWKECSKDEYFKSLNALMYFCNRKGLDYKEYYNED